MQAVPTSRLDRSVAYSSDCAFGHWHNIAIVAWRASADGAAAAAATAFADELMERYELFSVVHVVEDTAGLPTPEGRDALIAAARDGHHRLACVGVLLPRSGVVATMMVAFVRGARTLLRGRLHTIVASDVKGLVRELIPEHASRSGAALSMAELATAIEEVRALARTR